MKLDSLSFLTLITKLRVIIFSVLHSAFCKIPLLTTTEAINPINTDETVGWKKRNSSINLDHLVSGVVT